MLTVEQKLLYKHLLDVFPKLQWNLSKADTVGAKKCVRFRQMSAV